MKNALADFAEFFGNTFAPEQFQAGIERGRQKQYRNALASSGDNYGAMRQAAMEYGDVGGAMQFQQMQDQQIAGRQDAERMKFERAGNFLANLKAVAPELRNQWAQENWQTGGMADLMPMPDMNDGIPDDAEIDAMIAQMNAMGGVAPVSGGAEQFTLSPGEQRFDQYGNPIASVENDALSVEDRIRIAQAGASNTTFNNNPSKAYPNPPDGFRYIPDGQGGFQLEPIPGSDAASKADSEAVRKEGQAEGLDAQVRAYTTLFDNKAIGSTRNTTGDNIGAAFSQTGVGKAIDAVAGTDAPIGNQENRAAREAIQGLSMSSLMNMISASDVSARAMDSDAEMKAWLGAIRSDNYETALLKLYMLDRTFGDGTLLDRSLNSGAITPDTYYTVRQMYTDDAMNVKYYEQRARQHAALGGEVAPAATQTSGIPDGVDPDLWEYMDESERALFR